MAISWYLFRAVRAVLVTRIANGFRISLNEARRHEWAQRSYGN
jgi:hypothetical protein